MAKLITKFKYIKPTEKAGEYLKYIATREGVDKIDDSKKNLPATVKQKQLIDKLLLDFPDSKEMHEYEDYRSRITIGTATEFITRTLEDNASEMMNSKTYADYIATRPRAQRFGEHGLFTDDGVAINLSKVSKELNVHKGNVWTAIMSLRREDAARLGFDNGCRWRDMLRTQTQTLSEALKIPMENLRWYAAFHNESHHPHIHLIAYSVNENEGYLSPKGVNKLRSSIAKDIFHQDLLSVYEKQTEHRNTLKSESKELIAELITKINNGIYDNPVLEEKLTLLAKRLSNTSGKKVYGYLKSDVKDLIDSIVDEVAKDERVSALYNLWYECKEEVLLTYSQSLPKRVSLSQNKEFKSVRNTVIEEAMNIVMRNALTNETLGDELPDPDYYITETDDVQIDPADESDNFTEKTESSDKWRLYALAKRLLDRETEYYNPSEAVHCLIQAAMQNLSVAKYRLGKLFLKGEDVPPNSTYALYWLEEAVKDDNPYAEYLLGKVYLKGEYVDKDIEKAIELLKSSADQNNKYAAYTLGKLYLDGTTAPQDIEQALKYLTRSADNGFATAQYLLGKLLYSGELMPININKSLEYLLSAAEQADPFAAYLAGKIMLNEDSVKNIKEAVRCFEIAAEQGNSYAEYQLGKIYLYGVDNDKDYSQALGWLTASAEHGNPYAVRLLHSIRSNRNQYACMAAIRLLHHISRMIKNRLDDERKIGGAVTDRKLMRKIEEKKQAQGIKMG